MPHPTTPRRALLALGLALPALWPAARSRAQSPVPLRLIVPAPPGGPTDILARAVGDKAQAALGRPVIVDNRAGAGGAIGSEAAARAAPDGNTLVLGHNQTHASNQSMMANLRYHVIDSFEPVARLGTVHHALVVPANSPSPTLAALIERGRRERVTYASSQAGSASHVISETLARRTGMNATHIPYRGAAPAATDTMAGVVDFYTATFPSVAALVRDGKLRALAIGAPARVAGFPDVPTAAEAGQAEPFVDAWFGLFAPKDTPAPLVDAISAAMLGALEDATVRQRLENAGFTLAPQGPAEFAAFQKAEVARWAEMAQLTGIRMEE
ncbi:tripartite tricarboxylate transporter substrate binding protein [Roseomonas sp. OT10]|uniref:Bug family tripartite tricarboxylate transporter substrate binding protein n=1 Tax=Roseomonas cutis TaxID=2897332 RepID=UPI001E60DDAB|nr:tripartite tricarboxylate transporter substrate binding protein [Roseomonas sp. OT10]UFN50056.1 tripartite tricarboxylate transporter substrate binding protein [Roseomonas sp. OT10]